MVAAPVPTRSHKTAAKLPYGTQIPFGIIPRPAETVLHCLPMSNRGIPICKFYQTGSCTFGSKCHFRHVGKQSEPPPQAASTPCRFYLAGSCAHGASCRFSHGDDMGLWPPEGHEAADTPAPADPLSVRHAAAAAEPAHPVEPQPGPHDDGCSSSAGLPYGLPEDLVPEGGWLGADREDDAWDEEQDDGGWGEGEGDEQQQHYQPEDEGDQGELGEAAATAWGGQSDYGAAQSGAVELRGGPQYAAAADVAAAGPLVRGGATDRPDLPLCSRYTLAGICPRGEDCQLVHGDLCGTCGRYALHPYCPEDAEQHRLECTRRHERLAARLRSTQVRPWLVDWGWLGAPRGMARRMGICEGTGHSKKDSMSPGSLKVPALLSEGPFGELGSMPNGCVQCRQYQGPLYRLVSASPLP